MIRRPRRTTPATLVALVLLAVCVVAVIAAVQSLVGQTPFVTLPQVLSVTSGLRWNSAATIAVAIVVALVGLILLVSALHPGRPTVLPLARQVGPDGAPGADAGVRRTTLAKDLRAAAAAVPGVVSANVVTRRRVVIATVSTAGADTSGVPDEVRARLTQRLEDIAPAQMPAVRVRTRRDRNT